MEGDIEGRIEDGEVKEENGFTGWKNKDVE